MSSPHPASFTATSCSPQAPSIVLDTNVLLDWLVFRHPCGAAIERRLVAGGTRWIASAEMRGELMHVLGRGRLDRWQPDAARIALAWECHATCLSSADVPSAFRLRCSDTDDQKFIDFALAHGATLVSRDRAVLKLARRARSFGLTIQTPEAWLGHIAEASGYRDRGRSS